MCSPAPAAITTASWEPRPPSAGGSKLSKPARSLRRYAMKPVLGAWKFSQRAVSSLAFRNILIAPGGTSTNVPAGACTALRSPPRRNPSSPSTT